MKKRQQTIPHSLFVISVSQAISASPLVYDIEVDVEEEKQSMETFLLSNNFQKDLAELEQKVMAAIRLVNVSKRKREFLLEFVESPVDFVNSWVESQSADLMVSLLLFLSSSAPFLFSYYLKKPLLLFLHLGPFFRSFWETRLWRERRFAKQSSLTNPGSTKLSSIT